MLKRVLNLGLESPPHQQQSRSFLEKMSLNTSGIDHINLRVKNLQASMDFWRVLFGFEILELVDKPKGAIIGSREAKLALYENEEIGSVENEGFSHISFHVGDIIAAEKFCLKQNIPILYGGIVHWPNSRSLYVKDPTGYEVELAEVWGGGLDVTSPNKQTRSE